MSARYSTYRARLVDTSRAYWGLQAAATVLVQGADQWTLRAFWLAQLGTGAAGLWIRIRIQ